MATDTIDLTTIGYALTTTFASYDSYTGALEVSDGTNVIDLTLSGGDFSSPISRDRTMAAATRSSR